MPDLDTINEIKNLITNRCILIENVIFCAVNSIHLFICKNEIHMIENDIFRYTSSKVHKIYKNILRINFIKNDPKKLEHFWKFI